MTSRLGAIALVIAWWLCGCHPTTRETTIKVALSSADAASAGFIAWDREHQAAIVASAKSHEDGATKLGAYRSKQADVLLAFVALYQSIAIAATLNDSQSVAAIVLAAGHLQEAIREIEEVKHE